MKGTKKTRSLMGIILVMLMLLQSVGVGAQVFNQDNVVVNVFDAFTSYEGTGLPDGFAKYPWDATQYSGVSVSGYDGTTNTLPGTVMFTNASTMLYPLPEVIKSGILELSFDYKLASSTSFTVSAGFADGIQPNNVYSNVANGWKTQRGLLTGSVTDSAYKVNDNSETVADATPDTNWHKYQIKINVNTNEVTCFIDGVEKAKYTDTWLNNSVKNYVIAAQYGCYLDNWSVKRYLSEDAYNARNTEMKLIGVEDGVVELAYTDKLQDDEDLDSYVSLFQVTGGAAVSEAEMDTERSTFKVTLTGLGAGSYTLSMVDSASVFVSGKAPANTVTFASSGAVDYNAAQYYMNETFDDYIGGVPNDWYGMMGGVLSASAKEGLTAGTHDGNGGSLKLGTNDTRLAYSFKEPLRSGKYTIEFDVKNSGAWDFRLLDSAFTNNTDYITDAQYIWANVAESTSSKSDYQTLYNAYKTTQGEAFTEDGWKTHIAGADSYADRKAKWEGELWNTVVLDQNEAGGNLGMAAYRVSNINLDGWGTQIAGPANDTWTNVKLELDFYANTMTVTVGENSTSTGMGGRFDRVILVDKDTLLRKFEHGIGGLAFRNEGTNSLELDNVKVYSTNSYNANDTGFYTGNAVRTNTWYNIQKNGDGTYGSTVLNNSTTTSATVTDPTDASYVNGAGAVARLWACNPIKITDIYLAHLLATPVKMGTDFKVVMDAYIGAGVTIGLLTDRNYQATKDAVPGSWHASDGSGAGGGSGTASNNNSFLGAGVIGTKATESGFQFQMKNIMGAWYNSDVTLGTKTDCAAGWYNLELAVSFTSATTMNCTLTAKTGGEVIETITKAIDLSSCDAYKSAEEIKAIYFADGGQGLSIGNLKVWETKAPETVALANVYAVGFDGNEAVIADTITSATKSIRAEFTTALIDAETNLANVKLVDATGAEVGTTKALSEDKRSVILTLNNPPAEDGRMALVVSKDLELNTTSNMTYLPTAAKAFDYQATDDDVVITEFRVYEQYAEAGAVMPAAWFPVTSGSLAGKDMSKVKVVMKGYNPGAAKSIFSAIAGYDTAEQSMLDVTLPVTTVERGAFDDVEIMLNTLTADNPTIKKIKAFVWKNTTFAPLADMLDYAIVED